MIPEGVDIDGLSAQLAQGHVALERPDAALEEGLRAATEHAESTGFSSLGVAIVEHTPPQTADLRDIAQELMDTTGLDTVIVRAPGSGAVVSTVHSRAEIESAQAGFLQRWDYPEATVALVEHINADPVPEPAIATLSGAVVLVAAVASAFFACWKARVTTP